MPKGLVRAAVFCAAVVPAVAPATAKAGKYDLDLTPLGRLENDTSGGQEVVRVIPDNQAFRTLSSELGTIMAPRPVDPADSLGLSGFAVAADLGLNTINADGAYWQDTTSSSPNAVVPTLQVMGRKGLWPGLEVGAGATKLFDSRMWAVQGYGKISIHEGFHHLPIPSIAIRGMFSQVLGNKDIRMWTASAGISVSHTFGIGSTFNITPYVGYQALLISARSGVIDADPDSDEYPDGYNDPDACDADPQTDLPACLDSNEFVFRRQDLIVRHRPYLGARLVFSVLRFGFEAMFVPPGSSSAEVDVDGGTETVTDESVFQQQYTFSVGFDF